MECRIWKNIETLPKKGEEKKEGRVKHDFVVACQSQWSRTTGSIYPFSRMSSTDPPSILTNTHMLVYTHIHTHKHITSLFPLSPSLPFSPLEENARVVDSLLNKLYWMNQNDQSGYVHWYITYLPVDQGQTAQKRGIPSCCLSPCLPRSVF